MQGLLSVSPNLKVFDAWGLFWLSDATLAVCAQHCHHLHQIILTNNPKLTTAGVVQVIQAESQLRSIALGSSPRLGEEVAVAIAQHCPLLESLDYSNCPLSDAALVRIAEGCPALKAVHLVGTQVGDAGLAALAKHCRDLQVLSCSKCVNITTGATDALVVHSSNMRALTLPAHLAQAEALRSLGMRGVQIQVDP